MGAAIGAGSSMGLVGMALGPIWGGALFAYSSDPDAALGVFGRGRLFFLAVAALAFANTRIAKALPAWPAAGEPWLFHKKTRLQRLPSVGGSGIY